MTTARLGMASRYRDLLSAKIRREGMANHAALVDAEDETVAIEASAGMRYAELDDVADHHVGAAREIDKCVLVIELDDASVRS